VNVGLQRGLTWAAVAKSLALFVLPAPLLLAIVSALFAGDVGRFAFAAGGLASLWGAGVLVVRGLVGEARYLLGERPEPAAIPFKLVSGALTAAGAGFAGAAAGHDIMAALVFAALGGAGHLAFFGRDVRPRRVRVSVVDGVDRAAVTRQLEQGHARLRAIEAAGRGIAVPEFRERLVRITGIGRAILGEIERDPADAVRARRFLHLYLDSADRVTQEYARTHRQARNGQLENNFRQLLAEMEGTFAEQHRRLVEHEQLSLDVDIEVLNERLRREGLG
jgi:5-bromo-4-chloroindolyl phosphate hydrolysis protein